MNSPAPAPNWKAYSLLFFFTLLNILNFVDRFLLQSFAVQVIKDLNMTYFQFSLLTGLFFAVFYSVMGLLMGTLADRFNRPRLISAGLFVWSALTAASGLTANFVQMAFARTFVGVGEASLSPAALSMLSDVFPAHKRGFASGMYYMGLPLGSGLSLLVAGVLGPVLGWRNCFFVLGGLGVLLCGLVYLLKDPRPSAPAAVPATNPETGPASNSAPDAALPKPSFRQIIALLISTLQSSKALILLLVAAVLIVFSQGATILDQVWLVKERGFAEATAQKTFGGLFLLGGLLGTWFGGVGSDWFYKRYRGGRALFLAIMYGVAIPVGVALRVVSPDSVLFLPFVFISCVGIMLVFGATVTAVQELVSDKIRSTMIAFTLLCMVFFGTALGNATVGFLSDYFTKNHYDQPISLAVLIVTAVALPAIPCFYLAARYSPETVRTSAVGLAVS